MSIVYAGMDVFNKMILCKGFVLYMCVVMQVNGGSKHVSRRNALSGKALWCFLVMMRT